MAEQLTFNQEVVGSIPTAATKSLTRAVKPGSLSYEITKPKGSQ